MTLDKCSQCRFIQPERLPNHTNYSWFCKRQREKPAQIKDIEYCPIN